MRLPPLVALSLGLLLPAVGQSATSPSFAYKGPVKVELLKYLSARQVHAGSPVFVRVTSDWAGAGCALRGGAIIEGKVIVANPRSKHHNSSELALSFSSAQCGGAEMTPVPFVLAAVAAAPDSQLSVPVIRQMGDPRGVPQGAISSLQQLSTQMELAAPSKSPNARTPAFGQVLGIKGLKLDVAAGPERSSLLSTRDHDLALDAHTELLLIPQSVAFAEPPSAMKPLAGSAAASPPADLPHSAAHSSPASSTNVSGVGFAPCLPPSCTTDLPATRTSAIAHAARSIPIRALGYAPRPNASILNLDDNDSVAWLGKDRVLLAFNPHRLVHREGLTTSDAPLRSIHAVLLDVAHDEVISTIDWELSDSGRYLWQLSADRILLHAGHELRIYDSELALKSRLLLPGPLAFLRISPNGELISIGLSRERHAPALHTKLQTDLGHSPAEDLDILVVDSDFRMIAHTTSTSEILPPTLLNEGQLILLAQPAHTYRLQILPWQGEPITLARFTSACTPALGSIAPNLVFVHSCQLSTGTPELRVIRPTGQVVLKSSADSDELSREADGDSTRTFAVRVIRAAPDVKLGFPFHSTDLLAEDLRIYRATDGKRIAAIHAEAPAPSHQAFALSPDGSLLAVVAGARLNIYSVPGN